MTINKINMIDLNPSNAPIKILNSYIYNKLGVKSEQYTIFTVWSCKTLQNRKWIICTNLPDNILYELTYNGDKDEYYLDEYEKISNTLVRNIYSSEKSSNCLLE